MTNSKRVRTIVPPKSVQSARQRAVDERAGYVTVDEIRFNRATRCLELAMRSGVSLCIPRSSIQELANVDLADLERIQIGAGGDVIELDDRDIHIYVPGLLRDVLGLNAGQRNGGRSRSAAKVAASRANGASGGRPPAVKR